jgi:hypothetical protein
LLLRKPEQTCGHDCRQEVFEKLNQEVFGGRLGLRLEKVFQILRRSRIRGQRFDLLREERNVDLLSLGELPKRVENGNWFYKLSERSRRDFESSVKRFRRAAAFRSKEISESIDVLRVEQLSGAHFLDAFVDFFGTR